MKDPIEIAREIVDAARCPCALGHELEEEDLYCPGCLRSMIAAAIVAERGAGTTAEIDLDMPIESDTFDPPEAAVPPKPFVALLGANPTFPLSSAEIGPYLRGKRTPAPPTTAAIDTTGADLLVVGDKWFKREGGGEWKAVERTPHFCDIHRATSGEHDCGLSPCQEATIHKDLGPPRRANVAASDVKRALRKAVEDNVAARRALEELEDPACARCGGSGEVIAARSSWTQPDDDDREPEPCPDCGGKP